MATAALLVAILALLVAVLAFQRARGLQERLDSTTGQLFELRSTITAANEAMEHRLADVRLDLRHQSGETIFKPEMTIADALRVHPRVGEILAAFHLGGCSHCAVSDVDTIQGACQTYGIDQVALMDALNGLVLGGRTVAAGPASNAKAANVKVSF